MVTNFYITLPMDDIDGEAPRIVGAGEPEPKYESSWHGSEVGGLCGEVELDLVSMVWVPKQEITYHVRGQIPDETYVYLRLKYGATQSDPEF